MFILKLLLKTLVLLVFGVSSLFGHDLRAESEVSVNDLLLKSVCKITNAHQPV